MMRGKRAKGFRKIAYEGGYSCHYREYFNVKGQRLCDPRRRYYKMLKKVWKLGVG